jgi:uncharacterized protein YjbI with pentapeptide repeats
VLNKFKFCIFLRGAARTWNYLSQDTIQKVNSHLNYPDWYVMMPDNGTVSEQSLREDFKNSSLRYCKLVPDNSFLPFNGVFKNSSRWQDFSQAYFRTAWYDYLLGIEKREYEINSGIRYYGAYYTRPDMCLYIPGYPNKQINQQDIMGIISDDPISVNDEWQSSDTGFTAGARSANLMNSRYYDTEYTDGMINQAVHGDHQNIAYYLPKNFINTNLKNANLGGSMVRPTVLDNFNLNSEFLESTNHEWTSFSVQKKREYCEKYNISFLDYKNKT